MGKRTELEVDRTIVNLKTGGVIRMHSQSKELSKDQNEPLSTAERTRVMWQALIYPKFAEIDIYPASSSVVISTPYKDSGELRSRGEVLTARAFLARPFRTGQTDIASEKAAA